MAPNASLRLPLGSPFSPGRPLPPMWCWSCGAAEPWMLRAKVSACRSMWPVGAQAMLKVGCLGGWAQKRVARKCKRRVTAGEFPLPLPLPLPSRFYCNLRWVEPGMASTAESLAWLSCKRKALLACQDANCRAPRSWPGWMLQHPTQWLCSFISTLCTVTNSCTLTNMAHAFFTDWCCRWLWQFRSAGAERPTAAAHEARRRQEG